MKRDGKAFLVLAIVLSMVNLIDFIFYGEKIGYLVLAVGFSLVAFGTFKDNSNISLIGAVMVICGFIAKWFFAGGLF